MIITLIQRKGGAGKSTTAVSLAAQLSNMGISVSILDADVQGSVKKWGERRQRCIENGGNQTPVEVREAYGDIRDSIHGMYQRCEILIVDTGGFKSQEARYAMICTDLVLCPFKPKQFDLEVAPEILEEIDNVRPLNTNMMVRAIINQAPTNHNDTRADEAQETLEAQGIECLTYRIYNREAWSDAVYYGAGVSEFNDAKAKEEIDDIASEILMLMEVVQ